MMKKTIIKEFDKNKIIEFRFISKNERHTDKYANWSRRYEYPIAIDFISKNFNKKPFIHNTSCGHAEIHQNFCNELDLFGKCIHSDIVKSNFVTFYYDICKEEKEFENKFDIVLNISTLEHIKNFESYQILENLYKQVKKEGYLICTFDFPTVNLKIIEQFLGMKCQDSNNKLTKILPHVSLNIILLIIKK